MASFSACDEVFVNPAAMTFIAKRPEPCERFELCRTHPHYVIPVGDFYQRMKDVDGHTLLTVCSPCWERADSKRGSQRVTERRTARDIPNPLTIRDMNHAAKLQIGGSRVQAIGPHSLSTSMPLHARKELHAAPSGGRGYTGAHKHYQSEYLSRAQEAYARVVRETIWVNFAVHYLEEGKTGSKLFMNVEDREEMSAKITGPELKSTALSLLQRSLMECTGSFVFHLDNFWLRGKDNTNYERFPPSQPLFYHLCFRIKGKSGAAVFQAGKSFHVRLIMQPEVYEQVQLYMERANQGRSHPTTSFISAAISKTITPRKHSRSGPSDTALPGSASPRASPRAKRVHTASQLDHNALDGAPASVNGHLTGQSGDISPGIGQPSALTLTLLSRTIRATDMDAAHEDLPIPNTADIRAALLDSAATIAGSKHPFGCFRDMGRFIPAPSLDFNTLIRTRYKFSIDWLTEGCTAQIIVDERASSCPGPPGSFKTTHPGKFVLYESSMNSDHDQTTAFKVNHREKVVFKRWYVPQAAQAAPNSPEQPDVSRFGAFVRLGKPQEEKMLAGEVTCSVWATALTLLVYRAIQDARSKADPSDLVCRTTFPVVRFVRCGLFRVQLPAPPKDTKRPSRHLTPYLVEELIDTKGDSSNFVKYIHNGSAVPCITTGAEGNIASFLSFCQHLQYVSTGKQVYVSDFQGCNGILTDPQIMTTPELASKVFGDGNVGRAFAAFEAQHICTAYCVAYGLENFLIVPSNDDQPSG